MISQGLSKRRTVPSRELPTYYYRTHFLEMLEFVEAHYLHILNTSQQQFRRDFEALSFPAQCLYVRMANRRGRLFSRTRLRYPEIGDISLALGELAGAGFVCTPGPDGMGDFLDELLSLTTRARLHTALRLQVPGLGSAMKKSELVAVARSLAQDPPSRDRLVACLPADGIVAQARSDDVRFFLFLFFGRVQDGLSRFTMRDLGLVRVLEPGDAYEARFVEREDAVQAFFFATRLESLSADDQCVPAVLDELDAWPQPQAPIAADYRDRLALRLGRALEHDPPTALRVYERGESVECLERRIRLLLATGCRDEAQSCLERCIETPASDEEAMLASDLYARKFGRKRTSALTDELRSAPELAIDEACRGAPERAVADWFRARGQPAFRTENALWRTLFGLLFWDQLHQGEAAGRYSPFERLPSTLVERRFLAENDEEIRRHLSLLDDRVALKRHLLRVCAAHFGTANGVFRWRQSILEAMHAFVDVAPADALREIMLRFCDDYAGMRHGFPDLLIIDDEGARFVEVKADGDQLRRNQLLRLAQLRQAGFRAGLLRLRWVLHPAQPYAVVDVETTGGRGEQHRVTEIGAVKVVDGEIVDRFQTLLDPERAIPPSITRLTGITPEMIVGAPRFADIADNLTAFLDGAIFVAHNVEFDYGFIGREYRRLGRRFRMPKLCTCTAMRKLFPGHRSYGLAALCRAYDIPLTSHHRALCDAEAAAQLLLMINDRRSEMLASAASTPRGDPPPCGGVA